MDCTAHSHGLRARQASAEEVAFERACQVDELVEKVQARAAELAAKAMGSGHWGYVGDLGRVVELLTEAARVEYPVQCMDCKETCGTSTVRGSTGLCEPCLEKRG